ncbi:MAG: hypothetical protein ACOY3Z_09925 [Thermodesulfobacteriota bacterium]
MHRIPIPGIFSLLLALSLAGCAATGPGPDALKRVDTLGACQEGNGTLWSYTSPAPAHSWQEAAAFVTRLNNEQYLGHSDWRLPVAADLDRLHGCVIGKRLGDCPVEDERYLFVADESRPLRYESGLVGCGQDSKKEVNNAGIGHVRAIRDGR